MSYYLEQTWQSNTDQIPYLAHSHVPALAGRSNPRDFEYFSDSGEQREFLVTGESDDMVRPLLEDVVAGSLAFARGMEHILKTLPTRDDSAHSYMEEFLKRNFLAHSLIGIHYFQCYGRAVERDDRVQLSSTILLPTRQFLAMRRLAAQAEHDSNTNDADVRRAFFHAQISNTLLDVLFTAYEALDGLARPEDETSLLIIGEAFNARERYQKVRSLWRNAVLGPTDEVKQELAEQVKFLKRAEGFSDFSVTGSIGLSLALKPHAKIGADLPTLVGLIKVFGQVDVWHSLWAFRTFHNILGGARFKRTILATLFPSTFPPQRLLRT